jgi:preprotein translocase subunit SecD
VIRKAVNIFFILLTQRKEKHMKKNMGTIDRIIRILLAIVVIILYITGSITGFAAIILGILAIVFIITSMIGFCPLYVPFKISTIGKSK